MKKAERRYLVNRNTYKAIKKYDHQQMDDFLTRVYMDGYEDGRNSVPGVDMKDVLAALGEVKGIGPATVQKVTQAIEKKFGGGKDDEENIEAGVHEGQTG